MQPALYGGGGVSFPGSAPKMSGGPGRRARRAAGDRTHPMTQSMNLVIPLWLGN